MYLIQYSAMVLDAVKGLMYKSDDCIVDLLLNPICAKSSTVWNVISNSIVR